MKAKAGDLYLLQDGTYADPKECSKDEHGVLRHRNGMAVAMTSEGDPMTLAYQAEEGGNAAAADAAASDKTDG